LGLGNFAKIHHSKFAIRERKEMALKENRKPSQEMDQLASNYVCKIESKTYLNITG